MRFVYAVKHPRTGHKVQVCSNNYRALFNISPHKMTAARRHSRMGPGEHSATTIRTSTKRARYNVCRSFWYGLFDRCCQRPNDHTRLFPTNKPMAMIWSEVPWHSKTQGVHAHVPHYSTFLRARGDDCFKDVKKRPKHFHAQCGVCYRL